MTAIEQIGIGAGAILLAAVVIGLFRVLLALRDNTKAVESLDKSFTQYRADQAAANTNLIGRVENLERWRIAVEAVQHAN